MRVALSADEHVPFIRSLITSLQRANHELKLFGTTTTASADSDEVHSAAAREVIAGRADVAIVCSWSGAGAAISASSVPGVRAAHCTDAETARVARRWARANVLALSLRLTSETVVDEILEAWFTTLPWIGPVHSEALPSLGDDKLSNFSSGILDRLVTDLNRGPWLRENILSPLSRYDEVRGGFLQDTLVVFCRSRFSLRNASVTLGIHPNTVGYRMSKVREVTGLDYRCIDDLVLLTLAARVLGGPDWQTRLPWQPPPGP